MDNRSSCVPPGFRFHPTDVELVGYYLRKKVASQKIDLDVIPDIDLYRIEPWDLQDKCGMGYEVQKNEWYFFSYKDKKYPTGTRSNRATAAGFWKATGRDKAVYDRSNLIIGMRKTLVFYKGRAPTGQITDWIMHEYRLQSQHPNLPPQEEGWVVCRAFKKRFLTTAGQTKRSLESWDSTNYCDYDFVQLPQLESPSLLVKKPMTRRDPTSEINNYNNDDNEEDDGLCIVGSSSKIVTDWRDLDKFVASQLSQGDPYTWVDVGTGFESNGDSELGLLPLQECAKEEEGKGLVNDVSTTSDSDIGICIFNK